MNTEPRSLFEALGVRRAVAPWGVVENFEAKLRCLDCGKEFQKFYSAALHMEREHPDWLSRLEEKYSRG